MKYHIETDILNGEEYPFMEGVWLCYGTIVSEGNDLDELLENGTISLIDQDGGDRPTVAYVMDLDDKSFKRVERKFKELIAEQEVA